MHVLIIEDEPLVAADIECFLTEYGVDSCDFAETEAEAVHAALAHAPDLITADCELREGTGPAAIAAIRESLGAVPVVYITGTPDRVGGMDERTQAIAKPVLWLQLAQAMRRQNLP